MAAVKSLILCLVLILSTEATQILSRTGRIPSRLAKAGVESKKKINHTFPAPSLSAAAKASYNFAVDVTVYGSVSTFQCVYQQGYNTVFIQAYSPANGGTINTNLIQNLNNAGSAKLGNEIYVTPATSGKTGTAQFDQVFSYLKSSGVSVRSIWIQVTSPINWSNNIQSNINIIQSFISRANQNGVSAGVYTNWYDWQQITGSYNAFSNLRLWYWNAFGQGPNAEAQASFDDFRSFAGWTKPAVKQFALNEGLCGLTLNRDVYPSGSKDFASVDLQKTVGGFV